VFDLLGDFNNDGQAAQYVSGSDYFIWQQQNGQSGPNSGPSQLAADADDDGDVDVDDLAVWRDNYGNTLTLLGV